jgi:hypothetical protein
VIASLPLGPVDSMHHGPDLMPVGRRRLSTRRSNQRHVAAQAISNAGGRKVILVNGWEAVGWIGSSWVSVPEWQEYQLDVLVSQDGGGGTCFTCSVRPRWKFVWGGSSKSKRLAESLRREVEKLVHE